MLIIKNILSSYIGDYISSAGSITNHLNMLHSWLIADGPMRCVMLNIALLSFKGLACKG